MGRNTIFYLEEPLAEPTAGASSSGDGEIRSGGLPVVPEASADSKVITAEPVDKDEPPASEDPPLPPPPVDPSPAATPTRIDEEGDEDDTCDALEDPESYGVEVGYPNE